MNKILRTIFGPKRDEETGGAHPVWTNDQNLSPVWTKKVSLFGPVKASRLDQAGEQ